MSGLRRPLLPLLAGALALLSGCVTTPAASGDAQSAHEVGGSRTARLIRADQTPGAGWTGVRYDRATGTCSTGVAPSMSPAEFERRSRVGAASGACTDITIASTPGSTGYPEALSRAGVAGSAQVLVVVDETGRAVEAHAVCASVPAFAAPAVATALAIRYQPAECAGQPTRAAALVPFAYDPP